MKIAKGQATDFVFYKESHERMERMEGWKRRKGWKGWKRLKGWKEWKGWKGWELGRSGHKCKTGERLNTRKIKA